MSPRALDAPLGFLNIATEQRPSQIHRCWEFPMPETEMNDCEGKWAFKKGMRFFYDREFGLGDAYVWHSGLDGEGLQGQPHFGFRSRMYGMAVAHGWVQWERVSLEARCSVANKRAAQELARDWGAKLVC